MRVHLSQSHAAMIINDVTIALSSMYIPHHYNHISIGANKFDSNKIAQCRLVYIKHCLLCMIIHDYIYYMFVVLSLHTKIIVTYNHSI